MEFLIDLLTNRMRLVAFGLITLLFILETFWPYLVQIKDRPRHTARNMGLMFVFIFFAAPVNYVGSLWFEYVDKQNLGLLNILNVSTLPKLIIGILALDMGDYFYHRLTHRWKPLWSYHRVHHSDNQMDVTTGYRFHPFESLGQLGAQIITSFLFGYGLETIIVYYTFYIPLVIIQHTNLKFPDWLETSLGYLLATPNFHRVHHSHPRNFTDSNYGDLFSFWDRLFGTYQKVEPAQLKFGLENYEDDRKHSFWYMITEPFRR